MGGDISVEVTIKDGKVTGVTYKANETPEVGGKALPMLVDEAVNSNGTKVDGVSGATMTSTAFQAALADALKQAIKK